jgi:hypothetical protein
VLARSRVSITFDYPLSRNRQPQVDADAASRPLVPPFSIYVSSGLYCIGNRCIRGHQSCESDFHSTPALKRHSAYVRHSCHDAQAHTSRIRLMCFSCSPFFCCSGWCAPALPSCLDQDAHRFRGALWRQSSHHRMKNGAISAMAVIRVSRCSCKCSANECGWYAARRRVAGVYESTSEFDCDRCLC